MASLSRIHHPWEELGSVLFVGAAPARRDRAVLERLRITDVIDLTRRGRTKWLEGATRAPRRPERLHCPMRGGVETQPDDVVRCMAVALQWGVDALSYPGNVLLVHCRSGERRSTSLVYGILRAGGWSRAQALRALEDRPRADPRYADDAERALRRVVAKRA